MATSFVANDFRKPMNLWCYQFTVDCRQFKHRLLSDLDCTFSPVIGRQRKLICVAENEKEKDFTRFARRRGWYNASGARAVPARLDPFRAGSLRAGPTYADQQHLYIFAALPPHPLNIILSHAKPTNI